MPQHASNWLASRVQKLRERVEQSERAVEDYRKLHGLFRASHDTLIAEQISELSGKVTDATLARRAAEANLAQKFASCSLFPTRLRRRAKT